MKPIPQCKSCPWRVDCVPDTDIPNYSREKHAKLTRTIQSGLQTVFAKERHSMACHYSKPGEEFPCAGWMHHQLGVGNNIGLRMEVITGKKPPPEIDGPQHPTFEDTLRASTGPSKTRTASSTRSGRSSRTKQTAEPSQASTRKTKRPRASRA